MTIVRNIIVLNFFLIICALPFSLIAEPRGVGWDRSVRTLPEHSGRQTLFAYKRAIPDRLKTIGIEGYVPPTPPIVSIAEEAFERTQWKDTDLLIQRSAALFSSDCEVNFNDPFALSLFPDAAVSTFAYAPFWNQVCNVDRSVYIRPYNINHFHLSYESPTCLDLDSGQLGEPQEDGTCVPFADPTLEPRFLSTMLHNDVIELLVLNDDSEPEPFDFKRIRITGNDPVRVCYKPVQEVTGPWITSETNGLTEPGVWACWNNMATGYWNVADWAGNVTAVRLMAPEGVVNFSVDDIRIAVWP